MNHQDYAAVLFSNKEGDIAWLSPLALGEVSAVISELEMQSCCCYLL